MAEEVTPEETGSIVCPHCGGPIFFAFTGGPHDLRCLHCKRMVGVEVVHDGTKWRTKVASRNDP